MTERAIFEAAVEIRDLAKRAAFLDEACGGDVALRQRIKSLVSSHENASQFLNVPVVEQLQPAVVEANLAGDVNSATVTLPVSSVLEKPNARRDGDSDDELNAAPDIRFLEPSSKPGSIGTLGHYEILQVLGQGGFGIVFKAFDEKRQRPVAIKTMSPQMAATSPPRKRFLQEARSLGGGDQA